MLSGLESWVEKLAPELGVLGALVLMMMATVIIVLWRRLNAKDSHISDLNDRIQDLNDRRHSDQKEHTEQLMQSSDTLRVALDWLEKLGARSA